jgi:hypothetical protein
MKMERDQMNNLIKELTALASSLDEKGLINEANEIDKLLTKAAEDFGSFDLNQQSEEYFDYENQGEVEGLIRQEADAEKLADLIAAGDPATGEDESQLKEELTSLFLGDEYSDLIAKIMATAERR